MRISPKTMALLALLMMIGCSDPPDARLNGFARRSLERQADQNRVIARQSEQLANNSQQYLEAEQQSRTAVIEL